MDKARGIAILGGIAFKIHQPTAVASINQCLSTEGLDELPGAQLPGAYVPTVYRIEIYRSVYYSRQYERVTKRNSYTIQYRTCDSQLQFAFIECFVFLHDNILAVLTPIIVSETTYHHFNLTSARLCSHIFHVDALGSFVTVTATKIVKKCLYIEFDSRKYIVNFPSTVLFD